MKYYNSLLCVSKNGQQVVYKIKPKNKNKVFVSALARSLRSSFVCVFVVHSASSLSLLRSLVRGRVLVSSKVVSVF
jgi:hypothetical protein